ncbi:hypothetical protein G6F54_014277 [Rhizopus delemar]|nr:hypothetical protein G6F24_018713 [Rhizopus arrhizus]KAG1474583.1 hypothetical protein G6F54_014277 [Rhizopus delemar]
MPGTSGAGTSTRPLIPGPRGGLRPGSRAGRPAPCGLRLGQRQRPGHAPARRPGRSDGCRSWQNSQIRQEGGHGRERNQRGVPIPDEGRNHQRPRCR